MNALKKVQEVFKTFKSVDQLYQTSNGEVFFKFNDAMSYARMLKDQTVKTHIRNETKAAIEAAEKAAAEEAAEKATAEKAAVEAAEKAAAEAAEKATAEAAEKATAEKAPAPAKANKSKK
ncbi:MAG: hypothetical protein JXA03_15550 [Bacteroidales bacterium]|nr:hypothetical protein [Bacteroidales bacterium]